VGGPLARAITTKPDERGVDSRKVLVAVSTVHHKRFLKRLRYCCAQKEEKWGNNTLKRSQTEIERHHPVIRNENPIVIPSRFLKRLFSLEDLQVHNWWVFAG
jgi:hypothetical protein